MKLLTPLILAATAAMASTASASDSLLFTTSAPGHDKTLSGSSGTLLAEITREDVGVLTPAPGASAETYLAHANFNVVHGDKDCDGNWHQLPLADAIDALTLCPNVPNPRFTNLFFSVKQPIGLPGLTAVMTPGDVAGPRLGGSYQYLITEGQIRSIFDIDPDDPVDVDAVCQLSNGSLLLSLEHDIPVLGGTQFAADGDLLMIPGTTITYGNCEVVSWIPGSGEIVNTEFRFDGLVTNSGVSDTAGNPITTIGDLDGIAVDPNGGFFVAQGPTGVFNLPNLLFCGEDLEAAAVLTTRGGGNIAQMNGVPLAKSVPFAADGVELGLTPGSATVVHPLDGLEVVHNPAPLRVVSDVKPAQVFGAGVLEIHWGGCDPFAAGQVIFMLDLGVSAACGAMPGVPVPNQGFGLWYGPGLFFTPPVPSDAAGFGVLPFPYGGGVPAGIYMAVQPLTRVGGVLTVGGPSLFQFN